MWFFGSILAGERAGRPPAAPGGEAAGLSVYRETDVTYTPAPLCVVTSDQRSYSMQCICFRYRNIEKIFIEI